MLEFIKYEYSFSEMTYTVHYTHEGYEYSTVFSESVVEERRKYPEWTVQDILVDIIEDNWR